MCVCACVCACMCMCVCVSLITSLSKVCVCIFFPDFGFNQTFFSGNERVKSYRVQVNFYSGGIHDELILYPSLVLSGTASKYDVRF